MGNVETMKRGDVQMTSGGTGISHSEFNANKKYVIASCCENNAD
jgi:redox-sensitive bicupin YhaK (pirin superfamily)